VGRVKLTDRQAKILGLKPYSQLSPLFEKNCLLLSGNESFQDSEKDIEALTGIKVSHSTLQRLVHRQECIRGEHRWRKSPPPFSNQGRGKLLAGLQSRSLTAIPSPKKEYEERAIIK
jgi:hypothetical protein